MSEDQALQFALMMESGMPIPDIMTYFFPESSPNERLAIANGWTRSRALAKAIKQLQGDDWHLMTLDQRIQFAINKHYSELAYFLYTHNYAEASGMDKTKADVARSVLEHKLAGTAGKGSPIEQFWDDLKNNKIKLATQPAIPVIPS
jgi:hypothetical protein